MSHHEILPITGLIVAGGKSSRMGRDKALIPFDGRPLLAVIGEKLSLVCKEVIVIGPPERKDLIPGAQVIQDVHTEAGPLAGIHAGLNAANSYWSLVVACDMPFLNIELMHYLASITEGYDIVLPRYDGHTHQLHALYSKKCISYIENQIENKDYKIDRFFSKLKVRYVDEPELREHDSELKSFFNLNTPELISQIKGVD